MTLKKDFLSLSALEEANLVKSLTDLFEKLYPPLLSNQIMNQYLTFWRRSVGLTTLAATPS